MVDSWFHRLSAVIVDSMVQVLDVMCKEHGRSKRHAHNIDTTQLHLEAVWTEGTNEEPKAATGIHSPQKYSTPNLTLGEWIKHIYNVQEKEKAGLYIEVEPVNFPYIQRTPFTIIDNEEEDDPSRWRSPWTDGVPEGEQEDASQEDVEILETISQEIHAQVTHPVSFSIAATLILVRVERSSSRYPLLRFTISCKKGRSNCHRTC
jgi:hypothetical protein